MIPNDLRYSREHEWARVEGNRVTVGITDFAQHELGDVVFVELPHPGDEVKAGEPMATVESVKSVSDVYAPVSGKVVAVNDVLVNEPEKVNDAPYSDGWMVVIEMSNPGELDDLLDAAAYGKLVEEGGH